MEPLEVIEGRDWLGWFAGIARPSLYMIPCEQQFAENLHTYTLPRKGVANTRVRDLVDMVLDFSRDGDWRGNALSAR
jgi:hypothetical protein